MNEVKHPFLLTTLVTIALILAFWGSYRMLYEKSQVFSRLERAIIRQSDSLMYVCELDKDLVVLTTPSSDLPEMDLKSVLLPELVGKMLYTVQHPSQGGVGIAAPQVGVNKRIICVQRLDKTDEPFEVYLNIHIDSLYGDKISGYEGCLSVPAYRGRVSRYDSVAVHYLPYGGKDVVSEKIGGYTARIFQHEIDHLEGIMYVDRADSVFFNEAWAAERAGYDYSKPEWWPR